MTLPVAALQAKYKELADLFIDEVNPGSITLYYSEQTGLTDTTIPFADKPKNVTPYGGREYLANENDRFDEAQDNKYNNPVQETLKCRTYWQTNKNDQQGNLSAPITVCKVICRIEDQDKLKNAIYAVIDGKKAKIYADPSPYGLFAKYYCCSYWTLM